MKNKAILNTLEKIKNRACQFDEPRRILKSRLLVDSDIQRKSISKQNASLLKRVKEVYFKKQKQIVSEGESFGANQQTLVKFQGVQ